ncbi:MAG: hypothetical protein M3Q14_02650 [bacterium]|nr:hypothetical protein [bacterium]
MKKPFLASLLFSVFLVGLFSIGWIFRQDIYDYIRLIGYTPSNEIIALADDTTMLGDSRRLFYVNRPALTDKTEFNEHCREDERSIVLGCFISGEGIYLLNVDDRRLEGIEEVTAAHELLHAAYERLGNDQGKIDALVQNAYQRLTNDRVKDTVELYRKQDASLVPNELHSILGTEVRDLPSELETYYARYFENRSKIVALSEQYEQAFTDRRNQVRVYDEQLASIKSRIESLQSDLTSLNSNLRNQQAEMERLRAQDQNDAYNAQVPIYNSRVNQYNQDLDKLQSLIVRYNDLVKKRNDIASEEAELVEAIDSREAVPERQ